MARTPKPWYWKERRVWCATIRGVRHFLGTERKEAHRKFHELMSKPPERPLVRGESLAAIIDQFLDWAQKHRAAETYVWYQSRLQQFARLHPDLLVSELKPFHVQQWIDSDPEHAPGTRRNLARALVRCLNWAIEQGLIDHSPIAHFKKPRGGTREIVITPEQYAEILANIRNPEFKDLLIFAWETGARAAECLAIEKRHVELPNHRIVFPVDEEKMERAPRIIYLTETAEGILRPLLLRYPQGPLFRNTNGRPFNTESSNCAFVALQARMGAKVLRQEGFVLDEEQIRAKIAALKPERQGNGRLVPKSAAELRHEAMNKLRRDAACQRATKYCLTSFRHSFCHRLLRAGVDALTVSVLMGHADPTMIAKVYSHLSHAPEYLREALKKSG